MHTSILVIIGIVLGIALLLIGRQSKYPVRKSFGAFAILWFIVAAANMWYGVLKAGYPVTQELPYFVVVFLVPVALVWFLKDRLGLPRPRP